MAADDSGIIESFAEIKPWESTPIFREVDDLVNSFDEDDGA